ncbi:MMPL family transporter, partial [bacterium]|nr:MMPL family transporter [bacterium]
SGLDDLEEEAETDKGGTSAVFADLSEESVAGLKSIHKRVTGDEKGWEESGKMILTLRKFKKSAAGIQTQYELNLLQDLLSMDIKQPQVLKKLEQLYVYLKNMEEPKVVIEGKTFKPTGFVMTPVDFVRRFYKVFYHDSNPAFDRLPDVKNDGFTDKTLTDRSIIGVVLNQALSANRDMFSASITPNLKEFQVQAMIRGGSQLIVESYTEKALEEVRRLFPENDPYIETVRIGGAAMSSVQMSKLISSSQLRSIVLSFVFVFIVTFFIFRSAQGGLYSLIPLGFTVVLNFGLLALLGGEITMSTMLVASIAIGIGVDYTIHFLERFKAQLGKGDTLTDAYTNTALTAGRAILVNAAAVALGFIVLLFSQMLPTMMMGLLMFATMVFSSLASLTLLPAIILLTKPKFLAKAMVTPLAEERKN